MSSKDATPPATEDVLKESTNNNTPGTSSIVDGSAAIKKMPVKLSDDPGPIHMETDAATGRGEAEATVTAAAPASKPAANRKNDETEASKNTAEPNDKDHKDEEEEDETEEEHPSDLEEVYEALRSRSTPGSTCVGGAATGLPVLPGLQVQGVGAIPLPLVPKTAELLKSVAHQAPHGRGMETVVDTSVRNTLQINADQVGLENPDWSLAVANLARTAATALGVNPSLVRPELYKLLMYEKGGFFKTHRDTEKAQGMFATLVIQLPSIFEGGSFIVSHNGKSKTFKHDCSQSAPYKCYYVAHYADCEHELLPLESGYRLALVYSLCYTGSETSKPSVQDIEDEDLLDTINRLPKEESLFAIPMDHQYTTSSLARLGVGALKGKDRSLADTLSFAPDWKVILAKVEKTDQESGEGNDYYGDFEVYDTEHGDPCLEELFHQDGTNAAENKTWLSRELELQSIDDGGMILASEHECDEMWGEGDSGAVEYTGNEGANRETTYNTYMLIACSSSGTFERMCKADFDGAVDNFVKDSSLRDRLFNFMRENSQYISCQNFMKIYVHIRPLQEDVYFWSLFRVLVDSLSATSVPAQDVLFVLHKTVKDHGWNDNTDPIRKFLCRLPELGKTVIFTEFISLVDCFLSLEPLLQGEALLESVLNDTIAHFVAATKTKQTQAPPSFSYYNKKKILLPATLVERLTAIGTKYSWSRISPMIKPSFLRGLLLNRDSISYLADLVQAFRELDSKMSPSDAKELRQILMEHFVDFIEGKIVKHSSSWRPSPSIWKGNKIDILTRELLCNGAPDLFERVENWAAAASYESLCDANTILQKANSPSLSSEHGSAKDKLINAIASRKEEAALLVYKRIESDLLRATSSGKPSFSWSMPVARSGSAALDSFLRGNEKGPREILVGGGINHARLLAYGGYPYSTTPNEHIRNGFSAIIQNTQKTGRKASIIVTKTDKWFQAHLQLYETNMKELGMVREHIRNCGGQEAQQQNIGEKRGSESLPDIHGKAASSSSKPGLAQKKPRTLSASEGGKDDPILLD